MLDLWYQETGQLFRLHREPCASQEKLHWGGRGRGAGRVLAARVSHTRRFGRRRQRQRQRQAPPGRARARGSGGRRLPPSVARSLSLLLARRLRGRALSQRSREGRRGAKDADKFPQQPQIPAQAEAAAQTGQESAPRRSARPERPRRGAPGPFALRGAAVRDPMRRAREGREIRSPGGERQRRRAVLQLLEAGIGRQEAAERT
ncbi:uncharacterized protein LOC110581727 [Neomonachus schauinslandi]|uniref:Uncharacterized protein LOC110581727 n=1 Tax=Neomonachus schauinslandi TaxID=29088 RepID=A0A2Y9H6K6_NEOSC|nr:uncharacterized protein LOC110581727 [Neomonachus schauinslandi]